MTNVMRSLVGSPLVRYGAAAVAVGLALLIKLFLGPLIGEETPFLLFFGAVMAAAYFGGLGPGLVATSLAALFAWYFFVFPLYSLRIESFEQGLRLIIFVLEGVFISLLVAAMRSARLQATISTQQAREDRENLRESEERYRFLAEAGAVLSSSLDYRETLASVASLAVPRLADWCAVDLLEENGSLERLAVTHLDPEKIALAYELQERYPADPDAPRGVHHVLRTGEPEMMSEIPAVLIEEAARDEKHREILRELGLRSYMVVPLVVRGKTLGTITFAAAESGRHYGGADLELAEELARRAAIAVDNAQLYEEAKKEVAERERAEEELRSSRDQLEIVLHGVADGITAQDADGRLVYANEAAARIVGYPSAQALIEAPPQEVLRKFDLADESGQPFPLEQLPERRALRGEREPETLLRFREVGTDEERWAVLKATPVFDEQGQVRFVVSIFRDVTERKRIEETKARQARQASLRADVSAALSGGGTVRSILQRCAEAMVRHLDAAFARVWTLNEEENLLELQGSAGMYTHLDGAHSRVPVGEYKIGLIAQERVPRLTNDVLSDPRVHDKEWAERERMTAFAGYPLVVEDRLVGVMAMFARQAFPEDTIETLGAIATAIAQGIERKRVQEALREVRNVERKRMARDLHDGTLQDLNYALAEAEIAHMLSEDPEVNARLARTVRALRRGEQALRDTVYDLRIGGAQELPFPELLKSLVDESRRRMTPACAVHLEVGEGFPSTPLGEEGTELLRIIQEALNNVRRHSGASNVRVRLRMEEDELVAEVEDDGRGLDPQIAPGVGFRSMREGAAALNGELSVESEPGKGTRVRLRALLRFEEASR